MRRAPGMRHRRERALHGSIKLATITPEIERPSLLQCWRGPSDPYFTTGRPPEPRWATMTCLRESIRSLLNRPLEPDVFARGWLWCFCGFVSLTFAVAAAVNRSSVPDAVRQCCQGVLIATAVGFWFAAPLSLLAAFRIRSWPYVLLACAMLPLAVFASLEAWEIVVTPRFLR